MTAEQIQPGMPVVCGMDEHAQFGTVDHVDGDKIKLKRDGSGEHHYFPLSWAKQIVSGKVQVDRAAKDVMAAWTTTAG